MLCIFSNSWIDFFFCFKERLKLRFSLTLSLKSFFLFQGEYYNQDEVQAMVAAEVLEEEKKKKAEAEAAEAAIKEEMMDEMEEGGAAASVKKKKRGPMIAS